MELKTVEDLIALEDVEIQKLLLHLGEEELAIALKGASPLLLKKIYGNMSERALVSLKKKSDSLGPVKLEKVMEVHDNIIKKAIETTG